MMMERPKIPTKFDSVCKLVERDFYFLVLPLRGVQSPRSVVRILDIIPMCMNFFETNS